jgi:hypothetical protein
MCRPRRFVEPGKEHLYCRLLKSLYGLRQSPRTWYERIDSNLTKFGMTCSNYDSNIYHLHKNGNIIILMIYVDDIFITGSSTIFISIVK